MVWYKKYTRFHKKGGVVEMSLCFEEIGAAQADTAARQKQNKKQIGGISSLDAIIMFTKKVQN